MGGVAETKFCDKGRTHTEKGTPKIGDYWDSAPWGGSVVDFRKK